MMLYLSLRQETVTIVFFNDQHIFYATKMLLKSDELLLAIHQILKKKKFRIKSISGIILGPVEKASFSASRGITNFANTFAFALDIRLTKINLKLNQKTLSKFKKLIVSAKAFSSLTPSYSGELSCGIMI